MGKPTVEVSTSREKLSKNFTASAVWREEHECCSHKGQEHTICHCSWLLNDKFSREESSYFIYLFICPLWEKHGVVCKMQ